MPDVKVYIRTSDLDKWKAIEKKAEWIHNMLNSVGPSEQESNKPQLEDSSIKSDFIPRPPDPEFGYDCCQRPSPCKHWQWQQDSAMYMNTLTGKFRDPEL